MKKYEMKKNNGEIVAEVDGFTLLANAIVEQAARDLRSAKKKLKKLMEKDTSSFNEKELRKHSRRMEKEKDEIKDLTKWFQSSYAENLTELAPQIFDSLEKEAV